MRLALVTGLVLTRRLMHRRGEPRIPAPAASTSCDYKTLIGLCKFENLLAGFIVVNNRPNGNFQNDSLSVSPRLVRTFAVPSTLRRVLRIETEMYQRVVTLARLHNNVATLTAVAAGGPAARNKLRPPERHAAIAAVAGLDPNFRLIDEHRSCCSLAVGRWQPFSLLRVLRGYSSSDYWKIKKASSRRRGCWCGRARPRTFRRKNS